jgi:hypothetical protein
MNILYKYTGIIFASLGFSSCISTVSVPIDQLEPGNVALSATNRKVALISRNFKFSIDTLSGYFNLDYRLKKGTNGDNQMIDSIAVTKSLDNLRKALLESGRFDEVFVYPYNIIKAHIGDKEMPFTSGYIQSVCSESQTDAVISLEMLSFFYSRHKGSSAGAIKGEANVKISAIWSVYIPKSDDPVDRYNHSEVIRWSEFDPGNDSLKYELPGRKEAVSIASGIAAKNYSKRIVPSWKESSRIIIGLNTPEWDQSMLLAQQNKWVKARQIWEKYIGSAQKRVAGAASLNYAVAQEMSGDPEQATVWNDKAVKLLQNGEAGRIARSYAAILYERKLKALKLNTILKKQSD